MSCNDCDFRSKLQCKLELLLQYLRFEVQVAMQLGPIFALLATHVVSPLPARCEQRRHHGGSSAAAQAGLDARREQQCTQALFCGSCVVLCYLDSRRFHTWRARSVSSAAHQ
jgi:hypothetical protein